MHSAEDRSGSEQDHAIFSVCVWTVCRPFPQTSLSLSLSLSFVALRVHVHLALQQALREPQRNYVALIYLLETVSRRLMDEVRTMSDSM